MADMNYVSPLTSDLTDYYTKSEVDELQQGDAATYATSAEIVAGDNAVKGWVASQGYLTEHQDLTNYATISYVDDAIAAIEPSSGGMAVQVVNTLPAVGEENVLYLVFVDNEDEDNRYAEYVWVDTLNDYEMLGFSSSEGGIIPDLTDYATKQWVEAKGYLTAIDAKDVPYDNAASGLVATNVKNAIDEIWDNAVIAPDLAAVATSGDYDDLSNKPTIPSLTGYATEAYVNNAVAGITIPDVSDFIDAEQAQSIAADEVEYKMGTLSTVAVSGSYNDLTDKPVIPAAPDLSSYATKAELSAKANTADLAAVATTGSYNDLTNKPAIPTVPTNISAFTNDAGYLTAHQDISGKANTADLATVAFSGDYDDLANKPSIPSTSGLASESYVDAAIGNLSIPTKTSDLTNDSDFITTTDIASKAESTDLQTLQNSLSTVATSGSYNDLTDKPTIPAAPDLTPYATKAELTAKADAASLATVATSGDYDDLINKPTIPTVPTNISAFTNDADYLTNNDAASIFTTQTDFLTEMGNKANTADLSTVATSGSYNDLSDKPIIPSGGISQVYASIINPFNMDVNVLSYTTFAVNYNSTIENHMNEVKTEFLNAIKNGKWVRFIAVASAGTLVLSNTDLGLANNRTIYLYSFNYSTKTWQGSQGYQLNLSTNRTYGYINNGVFISYPVDIYEYGGSLKYLPYSNTASGLTATTIQGAIDELAASSGGGITVQDVIDEFNANGLTLDDGTASKVEIFNSDITATNYQSGTENDIDWTVDTYSTTTPENITFYKSVSENDTQTQGLSIGIRPDRNYETLEVDIYDMANNINDTKTLAFQSDIPSGYTLSGTYDATNKSLTLSVVER